MGHLLGASSRSTASPADPMSASAPHGRAIWAEVDALDLRSSPPAGVVAFAIDRPRPGDRSRGFGLEIDGWIIGQEVAVRGVRTSSPCRPGGYSPLSVRRPDVAAAHLCHLHAGASGFSTWASIDPSDRDWRITIEAVLASGESVDVAQVRGRVVEERIVPSPGSRAVVAPDFVIIGAQRGGTTSLYAYLSAHPQVEPAATKELHFTTDRYQRGLDWYLGQFPAELPPETITGEATPYALFHPLAPRRLREVAPAARLVALLRNPVDRAYSHYLLERSRGDETLDFASALDAERERLAGQEARLAIDPTYVSPAHKHASYVSRGDYAPQLESWFSVFPREQILVIRSEDLYERSAETFAQVARFLGISPHVPIPFTQHNRMSGPPLDPAIRRRLSQHFAPRNARLAGLLGWDPGWS